MSQRSLMFSSVGFTILLFTFKSLIHRVYKLKGESGYTISKMIFPQMKDNYVPWTDDDLNSGDLKTKQNKTIFSIEALINNY